MARKSNAGRRPRSRSPTRGTVGEPATLACAGVAGLLVLSPVAVLRPGAIPPLTTEPGAWGMPPIRTIGPEPDQVGGGQPLTAYASDGDVRWTIPRTRCTRLPGGLRSREGHPGSSACGFALRDGHAVAFEEAGNLLRIGFGEHRATVERSDSLHLREGDRLADGIQAVVLRNDERGD